METQFTSSDSAHPMTSNPAYRPGTNPTYLPAYQPPTTSPTYQQPATLNLDPVNPPAATQPSSTSSDPPPPYPGGSEEQQKFPDKAPYATAPHTGPVNSYPQSWGSPHQQTQSQSGSQHVIQVVQAPRPQATFNRNAGYEAADEEPSSYLACSILSLVCCCWIFGIGAVINSAKVRTLVAEGRYPEARIASKQAKIWIGISVGTGLLFAIGYSVFYYFSILQHVQV